MSSRSFEADITLVRWTGRGASVRSHQAAPQLVEEEMTP
jgi:hypothetical protein